jgi:antitoxin ChpS
MFAWRSSDTGVLSWIPPHDLPETRKPCGQGVILLYNRNEEFMHTTSLRKVGGSVMLAVPPAILDLLHLEVGATVGLEVDGERLVVNPNIKPRYTLAELLEASDYSQPQPAEEREWIDSPSVGGELI